MSVNDGTSRRRADEALTGIDVAVVGVATRPGPDPQHRPRSSWLAIEDYVALLDDRTTLRAFALPLPTGDANSVRSAVTHTPRPWSAVFVVGATASELTEITRYLSDAAGLLVIGEAAMVAAAAAAAALSVLRRQSVTPPRARVVVVNDSDTSAFLCPLLIRCGIGELTTWHPRDAQDYPLHRLMTHNHLLIAPHPTASAPSTAAYPTIMIPWDPFEFGALALPGTLSALCGHAVTTLDTDHLAAAATAIAATTPAGQLLPELSEPRLIGTIADHLSRVIDQRHE